MAQIKCVPQEENGVKPGKKPRVQAISWCHEDKMPFIAILVILDACNRLER